MKRVTLLGGLAAAVVLVLVSLILVAGITAAPVTRPITPTKAKAINLTRNAIFHRWPVMYPVDWPDLGMSSKLRVGCQQLDTRLYRCSWSGTVQTKLYNLTRSGKSRVRFYRYAGDATLYGVQCESEDLTLIGLPNDPCLD